MRSFRFRLSLENAARVFDLRPKTCQPVVDEAARRKRKKALWFPGQYKVSKVAEFSLFSHGIGGHILAYFELLDFSEKEKRDGTFITIPENGSPKDSFG